MEQEVLRSVNNIHCHYGQTRPNLERLRLGRQRNIAIMLRQRRPNCDDAILNRHPHGINLPNNTCATLPKRRCCTLRGQVTLLLSVLLF